MNNNLLNTKNQTLINNSLNKSISALLLKGIATSTATSLELIEQIEAKKRCKHKLPSWFATENIYYPNKLNIEQTSSEITAQYKANLVSGDTLIDITGGFGVDCFYFSRVIKQVTHCEINEKLSQIVAHNYKQLGVNNTTCLATDGIALLKTQNKTYDWIYIDPSRRDASKGKVFLLKDCLPNVPEHLDLLFSTAHHIIIKTAPLLDLSSGISELKYVKAIHCIAVNNEVKELLWILERGFTNPIAINTVNLVKGNNQAFNYCLPDESAAHAILSKPLTYLYEPNAAILKVGAFESIAEQLDVKKLHKHSHLYTTTALVDFPGRRFKINTIIDYNKKKFKRAFKAEKANVTTRNFPESVQQIRKKLNLKDGGDAYLFFTTDLNNHKIIIVCSKVPH